MVVEVGGGKSDPEKQPIDSLPLPGWTPQPPTGATAPPRYTKTTVKSGQCKGKKACGFIFLLTFLVLLVLTVYFGISTHIYKRKLYHMKRQCMPMDQVFDSMDEATDYEPLMDDDDDAFPRDFMGSKWENIAHELSDCIEGGTDSMDAECLKDKLMDFKQRFLNQLRPSRRPGHRPRHG